MTNIDPKWAKEWGSLNSDITIQELYKAKEKMKKGKAGGIDGIPIETILGIRQKDENEDPPSNLVGACDSIILDLFNS